MALDNHSSDRSRERQGSALYLFGLTWLLRILVAASLATFLFNVWLSFSFPVYSDEMLYRILHGRFSQDGGVNINLYPHCGALGFTLPVPYWMVPFRLAEEAIYKHDIGLLNVRAIGVGINAAAVFSVLTILWKAFEREQSRLYAIAGTLCLTGIGVLPFLLVMNRPDLWIRIVVSIWVLGPFVLSNRPGLSWKCQTIATLLVIVVPFALIVSLHTKAMLFAPVALASLFILVRHPWLRAFGTISLVLMTVSAYQYWTTRLSCPDVPSMQGLLGQGLNPRLLLSEPTQFIWQALTNLASFSTYWTNVVFMGVHVSQWLPPTSPSTLGTIANIAIKLTFSTCAAIAALGSAVALTRSIRIGRLDRSAALLLTLTASLIVVGTGSITKYFVESPLMLPLLALCGGLGLWQFTGLSQRVLASALLALIVVAWSSSQLMIAKSYTPYVGAAWSVPGYTPGQFISFNYSNYDKARSDILAAAAQCGIDPARRPRHLVVDDLTYPAMKNSFQPFTIYYLVTNWPGAPQDLPRFLMQARSQGLIASCSFLHPSLASLAKRTGSYCCVPDFETLTLPDTNAGP